VAGAAQVSNFPLEVASALVFGYWSFSEASTLMYDVLLNAFHRK
jgi:hypothetical protein